MARPFDISEDAYLVTYQGIPPDMLARDIGRPTASVKRRIKYLHANGAWTALEQMAKWESTYRKRVGRPSIIERLDMENGIDPTKGAIHAL